jgi:hypothetical protein
MLRPPPTLLCILLLAAPCAAVAATGGTMMPSVKPDEITLKDGTMLRGLILRNSAVSLLVETSDGEVEIPKENIRRIEEGAHLPDHGMDVTKPGRLPNWQSIVRDFRNHDSTKSFRPIRATAIDNGFLRNIPYHSFRVNEKAELNIYGDPANPVALELGVYGKGARSKKAKLMMREFLAGHLGTREEIAALYSLDLSGGEMRAGRLAIRCTPPDAPDAYGGWWLCIYDPSRIERARVSDAAYAKVTRPFEGMNDKNGSMRAQQDDDMSLMQMVGGLADQLPWVRGFSRDRDGVLRIEGS